jgi:hypothetical protein
MFDPKCYELAEYFLEDYDDIADDVKDELAQEIQDAIENWLNMQFPNDDDVVEEDKE